MWALLLAPAEGFGPSGKKELFMLFWLTLGHFWCSVETSVTFSSNLINFEKIYKIQKKSKKSPKIPKYPKIGRRKKEIHKILKNPKKFK